LDVYEKVETRERKRDLKLQDTTSL